MSTYVRPKSGHVCAHCGRHMTEYGGSIFRDGQQRWLCHPDAPDFKHHPADDPDLLDCYRLVTVYGEQLGARR